VEEKPCTLETKIVRNKWMAKVGSIVSVDPARYHRENERNRFTKERKYTTDQRRKSGSQETMTGHENRFVA
jgi:hypothetical protein